MAARKRTTRKPTAPARPTASPPPIPPPPKRLLRAYAFDPSRGRLLGNEMTLEVAYEKLAPGPTPVVDRDDKRNGVAVIDYDASTKAYYHPVNLDDPAILIRDGLDPSESDPRFHQQMVYAVVKDTIASFERALGRTIHWRRDERPDSRSDWMAGDIRRLNLYPHAMQDANAFYSPDAHGILFGYFPADRGSPGRNLPGQCVFTCLSHDIIVHETTHAILDGLRGCFIQQTNLDVSAFHEAFADLAALFRHFTHREVLIDSLQRTGGRLFSYQLRPDATSDAGATRLVAQQSEQNPLIALARQFGQAIGRRESLRDALGTEPNPELIKSTVEPHLRGSILVAAVFDAFFSIYVRRTADLFRIFRAGGGSAEPVDLPGPLAELLCAEAMRTANEFFVMCASAIDYCPPLDITFGEFLRAVITADRDRRPIDNEGVRDAWMQAFRLRGILPDGAHFFSEDALAWPSPEDLPAVDGLVFGDPNGLTSDLRGRIAEVLRAYVNKEEVRRALGFDLTAEVRLRSFHPMFRMNDGRIVTEMVVELTQNERRPFGDERSLGDYPFYGGATLIIGRGAKPADAPVVRYAITKPFRGDTGESRARRQRAFLQQAGLTAGSESRFRVDFCAVHGGI